MIPYYYIVCDYDEFHLESYRGILVFTEDDDDYLKSFYSGDFFADEKELLEWLQCHHCHYTYSSSMNHFKMDYRMKLEK